LSKKEKLKSWLRNQPVDFSYRELRTLLIGLDWAMKRIKKAKQPDPE
jgi:hypothetical protein